MGKKLVVVVGVGALGSHFVQFMRSEEIEFRLVDFDRIEQKNTLSQFHGKPGVGKLKVQGLQSSMALLWGTKMNVFPTKLTADNEERLLAGTDLIVDCLDNAEARKIVQDYVRGAKIVQQLTEDGDQLAAAAFKPKACLHGAVDAEGSFGRVVWDENFTIDSGSPPGTPTCEDGENLPFIATVAAFMARSAQTFLRQDLKLGYQISPGGAIRT